MIVLEKNNILIINGSGYLSHDILSYHVDLLIYCFHESLPASLPPPVAFSPPWYKYLYIHTYIYIYNVVYVPKAPPISAPLVGMLTLTIPQSEPAGLEVI